MLEWSMYPVSQIGEFALSALPYFIATVLICGFGFMMGRNSQEWDEAKLLAGSEDEVLRLKNEVSVLIERNYLLVSKMGGVPPLTPMEVSAIVDEKLPRKGNKNG